MHRIVRTLALAMLGAACGDGGFEPSQTITNGSPAGSTTIAGTVNANVSGEQFAGRLSTGATLRNQLFSFSAYDGNIRQIAISVRIPGPGTFDTGGPYSPVVSLIEGFGPDLRRWTSVPEPGAGTLTLDFISAESANGHFSFHLEPDSATRAAGVTTSRSVTSGTFNVTMSR